MNFNLFSFAGLILSITCFILTSIILFFGKNSLNKIWALFNAIVGLWGLGAFFIGKIINRSLSLTVWRLTHIAIIFIPILIFHMVFKLCDLKLKKTLYFCYLQGLFFSILSLSSNLFISDVKFMFNSFYYLFPGFLYYPFFFLWTFIVFFSHFKLFNSYLNAKGRLKNQILYLFIASALGFSGGITNFFPAIGINLYPFGNLTIPIYCFISTYAIIRYQLLDIRVAITRAGVFLAVYSIVLGIPFWISYHTQSRLLPTLLMFCLATPGPIIYRYFQRKAENILLAKQRNYQKALLEAGKGMVKEHNLEKLLKFITDIIKFTVNIEFVGIFLKNNDNNYLLKILKGYKNFPKDLVMPDNNSLIKQLKKRKSSLIYDEINWISNKSLDKSIHLILPLFMENNLLGFIILGEKKDKTFYTEDDINVFEILARQAVLAIDHCIFMEEFSKAQEKVFEAEKLASIGGMADGVAHQIKNRLNFFSIVSGEIKSNADEFMKNNYELVDKNPELKNYINYVSEIGDSLINNVRKTNSIIEGILSFARTGEKGTFFSIFSFNEIIDTALGLLLVKHHISHFPIKIEDELSDIVYGVKSQILECIYNVLDNCYEAIKEKIEYHLTEDEKKTFKPIIRLQLKEKGNFNIIEISDNGVGIKDENKSKIFAPFFTTKPSNKSGTGIGMYVVKRIIEENHKGSVRFESEYMKGTKLFIKIPKNNSPKVVARIKKTDLALTN